MCMYMYEINVHLPCKQNKCEMYWAEGTGNSFETDTFTIITDSSTHHKAFDVRQFLVTNVSESLVSTGSNIIV